MAQPRVLILRAPGTNCDAETAYAFERAGGSAQVLHVSRLIESPTVAREFQILCLPGGFSYGDDIASGRIFAVHLRRALNQELQQFRSDGKLILGICNGFQILLKSGLLLDDADVTQPAATLAWNESGRYTDRWVGLKTSGNKCVVLSGIDHLELPIAHGEGRFVARDAAMLAKLEAAGQLPLRYAERVQPAASKSAAAKGGTATKLACHYNPNGSHGDVAGACDSTGRVFGLMPHPERFIDPTQHPQWTRRPYEAVGQGLQIFTNAVKYFS